MMDIRAILMGLAFALMWSSAFSAARIIVADAPPLAALSLRFLLAGVVGLVLAARMGQSPRLTAAQWQAVLVFGICQNALYLGLNFVAMQTIQASMAAIVGSTMPLLVALAGWAVYGQRPPLLGIAGLIAGMIGVTIIMGARVSGGEDPFGLFLVVLGVLALTAATLAVRGTSSGGNVLMIVSLQMLVGSLALGAVSLGFETWQVRWSWALIAAFLYAALLPGLLGTWVWFLLVNRIGAVKAATFHFLNPFFGVAVAALLLGEKVGPADFIGVVIIMAGILAVQLSRQPKS